MAQPPAALAFSRSIEALGERDLLLSSIGAAAGRPLPDRRLGDPDIRGRVADRPPVLDEREKPLAPLRSELCGHARFSDPRLLQVSASRAVFFRGEPLGAPRSRSALEIDSPPPGSAGPHGRSGCTQKVTPGAAARAYRGRETRRDVLALVRRCAFELWDVLDGAIAVAGAEGTKVRASLVPQAGWVCFRTR